MSKIQDNFLNIINVFGTKFKSIINKLNEYDMRFTGIDAQFNTIEQEKASKEELNALGQLKLDGTYDTLTALQTAFPTGAVGLYLVLADGFTYRWNSEWVRAVQFQSTGIADNSVKSRHIDVMVQSSNLFDKNDVTVGQRLTGTVNISTIDNTTQSWGTSYATTGLIELENTVSNPVSVYTNKQLANIYFFDVSGVFRGSKIGVLQVDGSYLHQYTGTYQIKYIRAEYQTATVTNINDMMITLNSLPTEYQSYGSYLTLNGIHIATYDEIPNPPNVKEQLYNVFVGNGSGQNNIESTTDDKGRYNTSMGVRALQSNTSGHHLSVFGYQALMKNTTGMYNSAFGEDTLFNNTTGSHNTVFGIRVMQNNTIGERNTAIGAGTFINNTDGNNNTIIGQNAGNTATSEEGNTLIGYWTDIVTGVTNGTAIGRSAKAEKSDSVRLGNANVTAVETYGDYESLTNGKGVVLKDKTTGIRYRIFIDNGTIGVEPA